MRWHADGSVFWTSPLIQVPSAPFLLKPGISSKHSHGAEHKSRWEAHFSQRTVPTQITLGLLTLCLPRSWGVRLPKASASKAL